MARPETLSWAWKGKCCGDVVHQRELSPTMGVTSETIWSPPGPKRHGIEWVDHIPDQPRASGKVERYNGPLKSMLRALGAGTWKHWDRNLPEATWLVNNRGSDSRSGLAETKPLRTVGEAQVPVVHVGKWMGKAVWVAPAVGKGDPTRGIVFSQRPGYTWWAMQKDGDIRCVPKGGLALGENYSVIQVMWCRRTLQNQRQVNFARKRAVQQ